MDWKKLPGDDMLAEFAALKIGFGCLLDVVLETRPDRAAVVRDLCQMALNSAAAYTWNREPAERADLLREITAERVTALFSAAANPRPVPPPNRTGGTSSA